MEVRNDVFGVRGGGGGVFRASFSFSFSPFPPVSHLSLFISSNPALGRPHRNVPFPGVRNGKSPSRPAFL